MYHRIYTYHGNKRVYLIELLIFSLRVYSGKYIFLSSRVHLLSVVLISLFGEYCNE